MLEPSRKERLHACRALFDIPFRKRRSSIGVSEVTHLAMFCAILSYTLAESRAIETLLGIRRASSKKGLHGHILSTCF
jgi:hypothetical protein